MTSPSESINGSAVAVPEGTPRLSGLSSEICGVEIRI
jgi:hypothetical protein